MKIQFISDLHIEFGDFDYRPTDADLVIVAGDVNLGIKGAQWLIESIKDKPVLYVIGNHEYYKNAHPKLIGKLNATCADTNIHLLENAYYDHGDVRFFGATLWTNFELFGSPRIAGANCQSVMNYYKRIRRDPSYSKMRSIDIYRIHKKTITWLEKNLVEASDKRKVIISHHAPSIQSVPEKYRTDMTTTAYASDLEYLMKDYQPELWFHGHLHTNSDYTIGKTRVLCNPRGYCDEPNLNFNPVLTVEI